VCVILFGESGGAAGLFPEAIPEFWPAAIQRAQGADGRGSALHPTHPRPFESLTNEFAAGLGRAAADVPAARPVAGIIGAMAVALKVTD